MVIMLVTINIILLLQSRLARQNFITGLRWSRPTAAFASLALLAASRLASEALLAALLPKSCGSLGGLVSSKMAS